ncbi:tyrosine-type recombinase/integrase [Mycobacterium sp.]|uniref:tyrosine-type recombinase/integrase n=1 Tax=Mycobacterium sp. TaxID=1785 RepID=UPI003F97CD0B
MEIPDLEALLESWQLAMQAERKSPATVDNYLRGVRYYLGWCGERGDFSPLSRTTLQRWVTHMLGSGLEPATARIRAQAVRRFATWLADPEVAEIDADPFLGIKPPKLDAKVVESLSEHDLRLMLKACAGKELADRRDEACLRLLVDTGMRAGELLALCTYDVDLGAGQLVIRRGKGGKGRVVGFSATTAAALDRYLRVRRRHRLASTAALWLTKTGRNRMGYGGLRFALSGRAQAAGVPGFHIHKLRHTFASRWLAAGGSEGGLMATAGWSSRDMIDRYSRATASERAMEESRRLGLGDL